MRPFIKKILSKGLFYSGAISLTRKISPLKEVTVLMFHKVEPKNFEKQITYIKEYYNIISESDFYAWHQNKIKLPNNSVLLTFDDGYLNNYLYAWPILKKYKIPATIFLTAGFINKNEMIWYDKIEYALHKTNIQEITFEGQKYYLNKKGRKDLIKKYYYYAITLPNQEKDQLIDGLLKQTRVRIPKKMPLEYSFMSWNQINEMKPLITFGAHTINHPILPNLTFKEKKYELEESRNIIKKNTGQTPLSFCYPNGDYDKETIRLVKDTGYRLAFSSNFGRNKKNISEFLIQRIGSNINDTREILATKLTKLSGFFQRTKTRKHFKVVMITNYYYPQTGGITTAVNNIVTNLRRKNIKTAILAYPQFFRRLESLQKNSGFTHRILVIVFLLYTTMYFLVNRLFNKKTIAHSHSANFCAFAGIITKFLGVKTVHTFHTDLRMHSKKENSVKKSFLNKIDQLTAVSKFLGDSCVKEYNLSKKVKVIYNGAPKIKIRSMKKIHLSKNSKLHVLFVGHLFKIKDPFLFIKGIVELSKVRKVQARMIGSGNLETDVKKYIKKNDIKNISIMGSVDYKKMHEQYAWADVLALTSKGEGMGIVLLEAMESNIPVVSTMAGGSIELIEDNFNGVLIKERSPVAVSNAIIKAINNRDKYTKNAIIRLGEDFNWSKILTQYTNIYRQLTSEKNYQSSEENEA